MTDHFEILVVGGGVVGLTAALALAERNLLVGIIDNGSLSPDFSSTNSRVYAINNASKELFTRLNVWAEVIKISRSPYEKMHVWDDSNKAYIDFDARHIAVPQLGFIVEEVTLKNCLLQAIEKNPHIHRINHQRVNRIKQTSPFELYSNDASWTADLILVAEGAESGTRTLLDIPITRWPYHQEALVTTVKTELPHNKTAYQAFTKTGTLAFLPLTNPHQSSIVWSTSVKHAASLMSLNQELFDNAITKAIGNQLGRVKSLATLHRFPLMMRQASQYAGANWALLGDAAHTIHPMAGLGLNLGLGDVVSLLAIYDNPTCSIRSGLKRYQRERKYAAWQVIAFLENLKLLFINPLQPVSMIRGLALQSCNVLLPLKKQFISYAQKI